MSAVQEVFEGQEAQDVTAAAGAPLITSTPYPRTRAEVSDRASRQEEFERDLDIEGEGESAVAVRAGLAPPNPEIQDDRIQNENSPSLLDMDDPAVGGLDPPIRPTPLADNSRSLLETDNPEAEGLDPPIRPRTPANGALSLFEEGNQGAENFTPPIPTNDETQQEKAPEPRDPAVGAQGEERNSDENQEVPEPRGPAVGAQEEERNSNENQERPDGHQVNIQTEREAAGPPPSDPIQQEEAPEPRDPAVGTQGEERNSNESQERPDRHQANTQTEREAVVPPPLDQVYMCPTENVEVEEDRQSTSPLEESVRSPSIREGLDRIGQENNEAGGGPFRFGDWSERRNPEARGEDLSREQILGPFAGPTRVSNPSATPEPIVDGARSSCRYLNLSPDQTHEIMVFLTRAMIQNHWTKEWANAAHNNFRVYGLYPSGLPRPPGLDHMISAPIIPPLPSSEVANPEEEGEEDDFNIGFEEQRPRGESDEGSTTSSLDPGRGPPSGGEVVHDHYTMAGRTYLNRGQGSGFSSGAGPYQGSQRPRVPQPGTERGYNQFPTHGGTGRFDPQRGSQQSRGSHPGGSQTFRGPQFDGNGGRMGPQPSRGRNQSYHRDRTPDWQSGDREDERGPRNQGDQAETQENAGPRGQDQTPQRNSPNNQRRGDPEIDRLAQAAEHGNPNGRGNVASGVYQRGDQRSAEQRAAPVRSSTTNAGSTRVAFEPGADMSSVPPPHQNDQPGPAGNDPGRDQPDQGPSGGDEAGPENQDLRNQRDQPNRDQGRQAGGQADRDFPNQRGQGQNYGRRNNQRNDWYQDHDQDQGRDPRNDQWGTDPRGNQDWYDHQGREQYGPGNFRDQRGPGSRRNFHDDQAYNAGSSRDQRGSGPRRREYDDQQSGGQRNPRREEWEYYQDQGRSPPRSRSQPAGEQFQGRSSGQDQRGRSYADDQGWSQNQGRNPRSDRYPEDQGRSRSSGQEWRSDGHQRDQARGRSRHQENPDSNWQRARQNVPDQGPHPNFRNSSQDQHQDQHYQYDQRQYNQSNQRRRYPDRGGGDPEDDDDPRRDPPRNSRGPPGGGRPPPGGNYPSGGPNRPPGGPPGGPPWGPPGGGGPWSSESSSDDDSYWGPRRQPQGGYSAFDRVDEPLEFTRVDQRERIPKSQLLGWTRTGDEPRNTKLPQIPAPKFDGTQSYERFINAFHSYAGNKNAAEEDKFQLLIQCLSGTPLEMLAAYTCDTYEQGYLDKSIRTLDLRYGAAGHLDEIITRRTNKLVVLKRFTVDNLVSFLATIDEIMVKTRREHPESYRTYLEHKWIYQAVITKVPKLEQEEYYKQLYVGGVKRKANFLTLKDFLSARYQQLLELSELRVQVEGEPDEPKKVKSSSFYQARASRAHSSRPDSDDSGDSDSDHYGDREPERSSHRVARGVVSSERHHSYATEAAPPPQVKTEAPKGGRPEHKPWQPPPRGAGNEPRTKPKPYCHCCKEEHWIWYCKMFMDLPLQEKYELVRKSRLCFRCLQTGHGVLACSYRRGQTCGKEGCTGKHHVLLHKPKGDRNFCSVEEFFENCQMSEDDDTEREDLEEEILTLAGVSITNDQIYRSEELEGLARATEKKKRQDFERISVKTLTCELIAENGRRSRVTVVVDSGANNTNIDAGFAKRMGIHVLRSNIKRTMHQVTTQETLYSDLVMFELCPIGQHEEGPRYIIGAFTIAGLIEGTPLPDWRHAAEKYGYLKPSRPQRPQEEEEVVILLGTDYAGLMTGPEQLRGDRVSDPIAERTPLGWAYSGRTNVVGVKTSAHKFNDRHQNLVSYQRPLHRAEVTDPNEARDIKFLMKSLRTNYLPEAFKRPVVWPRSTAVEEVDLVIHDPTPENDSINPQQIIERFASELRTSTNGLDSDPDEDFEDIPRVHKNLRTYFARQAQEPEQDHLTPLMINSLQTMIHCAQEAIEKLRANRRVKFRGLKTTADLGISSEGARLTEPDSGPDEGSSEGYSVLTSQDENTEEEASFEEEKLNKKKQEYEALESLLRKQWEMEAVGLAEKTPRTAGNSEPTRDQWTPAQKAIDNKMKIIYLEDERKFQMSIPWKDGELPNFRNNRVHVKARQDKLMRNLPPERLEKVRAIFRGYEEKDYVSRLTPAQWYEPVARYLPFFTVCDENKETTPVRVVWDCKAVYHGKSLNSEIEDTPNRLQDLFRVLLRLRRYQFTITSDVSEMFLRVRLDPKDRPYHRFVFDGSDFIWNSILFGNVASPNGSQKVIATACEMFGAEFPEAVETLLNSFYMDDASDSRPTEEQALATAQQLLGLLSKVTMPIHKFYSNSPLVLRNIEPALLAKQVHIGESSLEVETGKILGMKYNAAPGEDYLAFAGKFKSAREWTNKSQTTKVEQGKWTKRHLARAAASIYDPHGLISPFTVHSKRILQDVWRRKELDWDTVMPEDLCLPWEDWLDQAFIVPDIKIERWLRIEPGANVQLHTFCDASEEGLCCAVFVRVKKRKEIHTGICTAKSRISPMKAESISRLELAACVMGIRLAHAVMDVYSIKPEECVFWTDSMVSLHWIMTPAKAFKAFVAHRIGEIQTHTEPRQWRHVPTKENPADIGTRKISALELKESTLWWKGPEWLLKPPEEWPQRQVTPVVVDDKEIKQQTFHYVSLSGRTMKAKECLSVNVPEERKTRGLSLIDPERTSVGLRWDGLQKLLRRLAYVIRFCRGARKGARLKSLELSPNEIKVARIRLIRLSQKHDFPTEVEALQKLLEEGKQADLTTCQEAKKSRIRQFAPFMDKREVIRSRGRLERTEFYGYDKTFPVILDRTSGLARLLVEKAHYEVGHPVGHNAVKARIQAHYVVLGLGVLVEALKKRCYICQLRNNKPLQQLQASLPISRLGQQMRPFADTGIDYAGPFELKMGRAKARKKVYVLVLTCMAIRAVHFEPTGGMETTDVFNAISRFVDIRGIPETITSDNQTSFVKMNKDLQEWVKSINFKEIVRKTQDFRDGRGISWNFNPPKGPHFGGVFEIMVKAMKRALEEQLSKEVLYEEEFRTAVSKAAWMLNSRPIQKIGSPSDFETLTPSHFLGGCPGEAVFPPDLPRSKIDLPERLRRQVEVQKHVWERFQKEVVPELTARQKWLYTQENVRIGDFMIEVDETAARGKWKRVVIKEVHPSVDGLIRRVTIEDSEKRTYERPITRLVPIRI